MAKENTQTEDSANDERRMLAVALKYSPGDAAPSIVAKGRGLIATEIISRARQHGIFVHESPELVALLSQVDMDQHIPAKLYQAVAELLAWIYQVEQLDKQQKAPPFPVLSIPIDDEKLS